MNYEKKSIGKNAVLNVIKQSCNIIFPLIIYPYVSRVLGAENLGRYSFSESVMQYAILFSGLGISSYAIREGARLRDDKIKIQKFSDEIFSINLLCTFVTYILYFLLILIIPKFRDNRDLLLIMGIDVIATTLSRDWINAIYEDFTYITVRFIILQSLSLALTLIFVKSSSDYIIYTIIVVSAVSLGYLFSLFYTRRYVKIRVTIQLNMRKHFKPVMILFANSLAQSIYVSADIVMLGFLKSDFEVGVYTLASKAYSIIKALLVAIIMVAVPRISNYIAKGDDVEKNRLLQDLKEVMYTFVFPCVVGTLFLSDEFVVLIGGNSYVSGGKVLSILCFALIFAVLGTYYAQAYLITHRKEKKLLISTCISAITNVILNIIFIPLLGIYGAALTTLISEMINCTVCWKFANGKSKGNNKCMVSVMMGCILIAICCCIIKGIFMDVTVRILLSVPLSIMLYFISQILFKNRIIYMCVDQIAQRIVR